MNYSEAFLNIPVECPLVVPVPKTPIEASSLLSNLLYRCHGINFIGQKNVKRFAVFVYMVKVSRQLGGSSDGAVLYCISLFKHFL